MIKILEVHLGLGDELRKEGEVQLNKLVSDGYEILNAASTVVPYTQFMSISAINTTMVYTLENKNIMQCEYCHEWRNRKDMGVNPENVIVCIDACDSE